MKASELAYLEAGDLLSWVSDEIRAVDDELVIARLNMLLKILRQQEEKIERLREKVRRGCTCMNCVVVGV